MDVLLANVAYDIAIGVQNMEHSVGDLLKPWNFEDYITNFEGTQI